MKPNSALLTDTSASPLRARRGAALRARRHRWSDTTWRTEDGPRAERL